MSTRANIVIANSREDFAKARILYHHHDGDELGILLQDFIEHIPTSTPDDFADFLKDYTNPGIGYHTNGFEDAKVISTDIDYIYYVIIYPEYGYGKALEGYRFPYPPLSMHGNEVRSSDGELADNRIYELFNTSRDFTYGLISRYWPMSYHFLYNLTEEENR